MQELSVNIVGISRDPVEGFDVNLLVNGKKVYVWVNESCLELKVLSSELIFYKTQDRVKKILGALFELTFYQRTLGSVNVKVL